MNLLEKPNETTTTEKIQRSCNEKYLTFKLAAESYGLPVLKVREIIRMQNITQLPQLPTYIRGIINLRGRVIPVICLRARFELATQEQTSSNCIIVVHVDLPGRDQKLVGLVVDAVEEVYNVATTDVEAAPDFGNGLTTEFIHGIAKIKNSVKTLLDIEKVIRETPLDKLPS